MPTYLEQGSAPTLVIGPFVDPADGDTDITNLTTDYLLVFLSKNGGDLTSKHDATDLAHAGAGAAATSLGYYHCVLDATDTDTLGILKVIVHVATAMQVWHEYQVITHDAYQSLCGDHVIGAAAITAYDPPTNTEFEARSLPSADYVVVGDTIAGCTLVATTTAVTNGVTLAADAITAAAIGDNAFAVEHFADDCLVAANFGDDCFVAANFGDDCFVAANFATDCLTDDAVADAFFTCLADDTDVAAAVAANATIAAAIANVASILADTGTDGVVLGADAITSAKIADNAFAAEHFAAGCIDNATFAADVGTTALASNPVAQAAAKGAWDSLVASHVIATTFGKYLGGAPMGATIAADLATIEAQTDDIGTAGAGLTAITGAALSATGANLILKDSTFAVALATAMLDQPLATGDADTLNERTVRSALRILRNKVTTLAGTLTVTKENDTDAAWTATITSDAGANPITSIDPAS